MVGDLNVAPHEHDVWSHKQLLKVVSHTPVEVEKLLAVQMQGGIDVARDRIAMSEKVYTWWSYRSPDWTQNDRGRRLDKSGCRQRYVIAFAISRLLVPHAAGPVHRIMSR